MKKNLHPKIFFNVPVYCNGRIVKKVSSTKNSIFIEIWSGNHSFFTKSGTNVKVGSNADRFLKKYNF